MAKQTGGDHGDGSWFLEAVGATKPSPTGGEALSELTKENQIVDRDTADSGDPTPPQSPHSEALDELSKENEVTADADTSDHGDPTETAPSQPAAGPTDSDGVEHDAPGDTSQLIKTTQVTFSSFDGDPGTANSTFASPKVGRPISAPPPPPTQQPNKTQPERTQVAAAGVGAATAVMAQPPASPSTPAPESVSTPSGQTAQPSGETDRSDVGAELARPIRTERSFRWPIIVVLGLVIVAVAVGAFWLPRATEAEAVAVRQSYYDATAAVRNQLPASQATLDVITNPESTAEQLNASIPAIAQLDTLAFGMRDVASEPLPSVIPFLPKGAIDDLVPLQETTALLGEDGGAIAKRLGNAYIYRISVPTLMSPGNLPIAAGTETINTISVTLAASLADDAGVIAELPDDPTFTAVHAEALATHDRYAQWQREYLGALTDGNQDEAKVLVDELDTMRTELNATNDAALATSRTELDGRIVSYAVDLEDHMAALTQT